MKKKKQKIEEKYVLTKEKAKEMIAFNADDTAHTFYNLPFGLIGADHSKESLFSDIDSAYELQWAGESAKAMGYSLAIIPTEDCLQRDVLFVETKQEYNK